MEDLPISPSSAKKVALWMKTHFGQALSDAVNGTPFSVDILCGIACQETAYFWVSHIDDLTPDDILARCVLDASGDYPNTSRSAFPKNTQAFRDKYGPDFTNMLIDEANKTRAIRGYPPQHWVYKGYGLYQYDLQSVLEDEPFFRQKQWYDHAQCLARVMKELNSKYQQQQDVWRAVRAYNGSGSAAEQYMENVKRFTEICSQVNP